QLIGYGRLPDKAKIAAEMPALVAGFDVLKSEHKTLPEPEPISRPAPEPLPTPGGFTTNFISPRYEYTLALANSSWMPYPGLEKDFPQAEFGASHGDAWLAIVPLTMPEENPALDNLTTGMLALMGINYPEDNLRNRADFETNGLVGVRYE